MDVQPDSGKHVKKSTSQKLEDQKKVKCCSLLLPLRWTDLSLRLSSYISSSILSLACFSFVLVDEEAEGLDRTVTLGGVWAGHGQSVSGCGRGKGRLWAGLLAGTTQGLSPSTVKLHHG